LRDLAKEAGIPNGRVLYLDIETGGLQSPASVAYLCPFGDLKF